MKLTGDPHNGGKRVTISDVAVVKPRPVLWEWLFFAIDSELRREIDCFFVAKNGYSPFDCVPVLAFQPRLSLLDGGEIELFSGHGWYPPLTSEDCYRLGMYCGLMTYLGVSDVHEENIVLQCVAGMPFVFACVDVESIFLDISHPRETGLLPAHKTSSKHHSLSLISQGLLPERRMRMVRGYVDAIIDLMSISGRLADIFAAQPGIGDCPIRILPRDTYYYYSFIEGRNSPSDHELSPCEKSQLKRGDIPYYFRTLDDPSLKYWADSGTPSVSQLADDLLIRLPSLFDPRSPAELLSRGPKTVVRGAMELADYVMSDMRRECIKCGNDVLAVYDDHLFLEVAGLRAQRPNRWFCNWK